jgi:hypothetical protein
MRIWGGPDPGSDWAHEGAPLPSTSAAAAPNKILRFIVVLQCTSRLAVGRTEAHGGRLSFSENGNFVTKCASCGERNISSYFRPAGTVAAVYIVRHEGAGAHPDRR